MSTSGRRHPLEVTSDRLADLSAMAMPLTAPLRLRRALDGLEPAEVLPPAERDRLMRILCGYGWTDVQIAVHTLWSTYTVGRIRERLGLVQNKQDLTAA